MRKILTILLALALALGAVWLFAPSFMVGEEDMAEPRSEIHGAVHQGQIYTTGGIGFFRTLKSCERFDVAKDEWLGCPDLPRALHHVAMAADGVHIYASGGYSSLPFIPDEEAALFALDPANGAGWEEVARLPAPLGQHAMVHRDGALYFVGGDSNGTTIPRLQRFDLASGEWSDLSPMPTARHSHAIAMDADTLAVTGGRSADLGVHSTVIEAYDFESDSWRTLPDAPFPLGGHGAAIIERRLHVYGGEDVTEGVIYTDHYSLDLGDPKAGWREEAPVPAPRHGFATAAFGSTIYILGGGKRAGPQTPWSVTGSALKIELGPIPNPTPTQAP